MSASVCLKVFPRIYKKCGAGRAAGLAARPGGLCAFFSKSSLRSAAQTLVNEKQTPLSTLSPSFSFLFLSLPSPHLLPSNFSTRRVAGAGAGQPAQAGSAGAREQQRPCLQARQLRGHSVRRGALRRLAPRARWDYAGVQCHV